MEGKPRETKVMIIKARRCQRCGGLLTSDEAIRIGYGASCLKKMRQEAREREEAKRFRQLDIFDCLPSTGNDLHKPG